MLQGKSHPVPHQKIWAAAYTGEGKEYIEIRTFMESDLRKQNVLWHKEFSLGRSLTDFLYVDLFVMKSHLTQMQEYVKAINEGNDTENQFAKLFSIVIFWLKNGAVFAPFAAAIERLHIQFDNEKALSMTEIKKLAARYKELQVEVKNVVECFAVEKSENMALRYLNLQAKKRDQYPTLHYGTMSLEVVMKGGNMPYPYDDIMEISDFVPRDFDIAEVLTTESPDDLIYFLLSRYLTENVRFRTCKFCGKYFGVTRNYKPDYCDRQIAGTNKTCKESGALRLYEKRKLENPAIKEYKRSYKAHNARIRYGVMTKEEFAKWSEEARAKRDACVAGKLSLKEFVAWLDRDKR